jgi:hypothetical protein
MSADMAGGQGEERGVRGRFPRMQQAGDPLQEESRLWHNQSHHLSFQDKKQSFF